MKHSSLGNFEMTTNAERVLEEYFCTLQRLAIQQNISQNELLQLAENEIHQKTQTLFDAKNLQKIDAEAMLDVLASVGTPEEIATKCRQQSDNSATKAPVSKSLSLSDDNRVIGGVCGGIAEYFQIDAVLVRSAFIACCFLAGMTFFIYPVLWLILHDKEPYRKHDYPPLVALCFQLLQLAKLLVKPLIGLIIVKAREHVEARIGSRVSVEVSTPKPRTQQDIRPPKQTPKAGKSVTRSSVLGKIFAIAAFVLMSVFFYLPASLVFLSGASYCLWGTFYPIIHVNGFQFSFAELDIPGLVFAISTSLLCLCLFLLVVTFAGRLHFRAKVLGKNSLVITILLVVFSLFGVISSFAIISFQHKAEADTSWAKNFTNEQQIVQITADQLATLRKLPLRLKHVQIHSEGNQFSARCTIKARGENEEQIRRYLNRFEAAWQEGEVFPEIAVSDEQRFCFAQATVEIAIPRGKGLQIQGQLAERLIVAGEFAQGIELAMENSDIHCKDLTADSLTLQSRSCSIQFLNCKIGTIKGAIAEGSLTFEDVHSQRIEVTGNNSEISLRRCSGILQLDSDKGRIFIGDSQGTLTLKANRGNLAIHNHRFADDSVNVIDADRGKMTMLLHPEHIPQIKMDNVKGRISNRLSRLPNRDAVVEFHVNRSKVHLDTRSFRSDEYNAN